MDIIDYVLFIYPEELFLNKNEYIINRWTYEEYLEINNIWVTPFDPINEIRIGDLSDFKKQVEKLHITEKIKFIRSNKHLYAKSRTFYTIADIISRL